MFNYKRLRDKQLISKLINSKISKNERYGDVILRLIVDLENAENMLRYFIQKM